MASPQRPKKRQRSTNYHVTDTRSPTPKGRDSLYGLRLANPPIFFQALYLETIPGITDEAVESMVQGLANGFMPMQLKVDIFAVHSPANSND